MHFQVSRMKGMDVFCSSPASTAVISSMDQRFVVGRSPRSYGQDGRKSMPRVPCSSHFPMNPIPKAYYYQRKSTSSSSSSEKQNDDVRRKSCVEVSDCMYGSSRRYLLGDAPFIDWVSHSDQIPPMLVNNKDKDHNYNPASKYQVVVLRVSLHCKGCEGKVRKHISKMEGVRWFSIDLQTKKVTIVGDVSPLGVLASVSKVKKAQLWPSSSSSSTVPSLVPPYST